jgi:hypothetical protein
MNDQRHTHRQPVIVQRSCSLGVITFKQLEWTNHFVHLVDISKNGVGVESAGRIDPGFVWFNDRVGGCKGGVLLWSKCLGTQYRAGIRLVPLTRDEELYVQQRSAPAGPHKPLRNPEELVQTIINSMTKNDH